MSTVYALSVFNFVKYDILVSAEEAVCRQESVMDGWFFFVELTQLYAQKPAWSFEATANDAYPVLLALRKFSKRFEDFLLARAIT